MALAHAAWTHGHAFEVEFPPRIARETRYGFYLRVEGRPSTDNWVHCAVPTPVIVREKRLRVGKVLLRYRTAGGALIHAVHVYDGESKIAEHNGLNHHPEEIVLQSFDVGRDPEVRWGLGISIGVRFPRGGHIDFVAGGCDFMGEGGRVTVVARP